jgi:hypothetical protein
VSARPPVWKCGHRRTPKDPKLAKYGDEELAYAAGRSNTLTVRLACAEELADRRRDCPACQNANDKLEAGYKRQRRGWFAMALVGAAMLIAGVTTCSANAAASDPCAPYTPADGRTCQRPTSLHYIGNAPICVCRRPKVANR